MCPVQNKAPSTLYLRVLEHQTIFQALWWLPMNLLRGVFSDNGRIKHKQAVQTALLFSVGRVCKLAAFKPQGKTTP